MLSVGSGEGMKGTFGQLRPFSNNSSESADGLKKPISGSISLSEGGFLIGPIAIFDRNGFDNLPVDASIVMANGKA